MKMRNSYNQQVQIKENNEKMLQLKDLSADK